jgi:anti-anti-sigma factor
VGKAGKPCLVNTLSITVTAGEGGPIITLAGEADLSNALQLLDVIIAQIASGATCLTIDIAGLSFADSRALSTLVAAGTTLKALGGRLVVLRPQETVLRMLTLLRMDRVVTIGTSTDTAHAPEDDARDSP